MTARTSALLPHDEAGRLQVRVGPHHRAQTIVIRGRVDYPPFAVTEPASSPLSPAPGAEPALVLSRRGVLVLGAAATAVLAAAYAGLRQVGSYPEPPPELTGLRVLTPKEVAIFKRLGDFLLPPGGPLPGTGGDDETIRRMDAFYAGMPDHKRLLCRGLPLAFEHGTTLDRFGARCMTHLPDGRCETYLETWADAKIIVKAQLWTALKMFYGMTYFERPDVLAVMGFAVPCGRPS